MILVDTSVLIDFFRGIKNPQSEKLYDILRNQIPFGITSLIYQEILQGAKDKEEFDKLNEYLCSQVFYQPKDQLKSYEEAAKMYFELRKKGITVRSTIDCLIVQIAKEYGLFLLHNDNDYVKLLEAVDVKPF